MNEPRQTSRPSTRLVSPLVGCLHSRAAAHLGSTVSYALCAVLLALASPVGAQDKPVDAPAAAPASAPGAAPTSALGTAPESVSATAPLAVSADTVRAALAGWGCEPSDLLTTEDRWYAACGEAGVLVVARGDAGSLVLLEQRRAAGRARALFAHGGTVWVESTLTEARPLAELTASTGLGAPTQLASQPRTDLRPSTAQAPVYTTRPRVGVPDPAAPKPSLIAPPRMGGLWTLEGALRPFLPLSSLSFAGLVDVAATYRFESPWYARVSLYPFGGVIGKGSDAGLFGVTASGGYDHPYFSVGIGLGLLRRGELRGDFDSVNGRFREWNEHSVTLAVTQTARLGALDGLNLSLTNAFALSDDEWLFGYVDVAIQIPINRQTWIVTQGGGGEQGGFFYSELGLRRLVRGNRGSGSLFVRPAVGVAGVDPRTTYTMLIGPMVGFHVEWRK